MADHAYGGGEGYRQGLRDEFEGSDLYSESSSSSRSKEQPQAGSPDRQEVELQRLQYKASPDGANRRDGTMDMLLRLAEALEMDEGGGPGPGPGGQLDYYPEPLEDDAQLLDRSHHKLLGNKVSFDMMGTATLMDTYKGYTKRHMPVIEDDADEAEQEELEYCAAPFNNAVPEMFPEPEKLPEGERFAKRFVRRRRLNPWGVFVNIVFLAAFVFYMYIRITKTMDLGSYLWYGIFVLIVEIMGATTTVFYGINLLMDPVHEPPAMDPERPNLPVVGRRYHARVLIPVYKESLEIVSRTVKAAADALLPEGCTRTIYLLDDGKDPAKRVWCLSQGPDYVYVSGRQRPPGEVNGKSANLNNCLAQIYPEGVPIPPHEVVCVFDADQVANRDFFLKTLPLFDGGDDVGMVLSPQYFHNLRVHADIFNHANVHFWNYAQHGYDALGFISCTGTNFLTRANCFQECGWSPTYTLTEDYALGMELKRRGWHCRYTEEILAIGEAPEQVRNCFQQRSRWCKGHFQIVLSWEHCPLRQKGLSWGMRILYCSGVWSYVVGAITTPTFILIPLLTVWAGIFPIVVSWWAACGLTAYMGAQALILNYTRSFKHIFPLWFAGVCNQILWFTYVKALWRALTTTILRKELTFKSTLKGANKLMDSALGDLWIPVLVFGVLIATLVVGLQKLVAGPSVVTTLAISVVWMIYGLVPPLLLLFYTIIGRGKTLSVMCYVCFLASWLASVCAVVLLWLVYPQQYDFGKSVHDSLLFFEAERVGALPITNRIPWRGDSLLYEKYPISVWPTDLTGGYMSGAEANSMKLTMPTAFTTSMLAWGLLAFPQGFQKANQTGYARDTIKWGTDYLLKMFLQLNGSTPAKPNYAIIYQVGNFTNELQYWGRPENMTAQNNPRGVYQVTSAKAGADLAASLSAAFTSAYLVFNSTDPTYAATLLDASLQMYNAAIKGPGNTYTAGMKYDCTSRFAKQYIMKTMPSTDCLPPELALGGSAAAVYNSTTWMDDMVWAGAWLYKATNQQSYLNDVNNYYGQYVALESGIDTGLQVDWNHVWWPANVLLANVTDWGAFHMTTKGYFQKWICGYGNTVRYTPRGRAFNPYGPTLGHTANTAFLSILYASFGTSQTTQAQRDRYTCWGRGQMRYMVGDAARSLLVGEDKNPPQRPRDMAASCPAPPANCTMAVNLDGNGKNPHVITGALVEFSAFSDNYRDVRTSNYSRVAVEYNAGFTSAAAGLNQASGTWDQCLQGFGVFTSDKAVCDAAATL